MTKKAFLSELRGRLRGLPREDIDDRIRFYDEMIDDRIEDGLTESAAVRDIGSVESVYEQILRDTPLLRLAKERIRAKGGSGAKIALLLALFPLWIAVFAVALSLIVSYYATLFSLFASVVAVLVAFAVSAPAGVIIGIIDICVGEFSTGLLALGAGIALGGLSVLLFLFLKPILSCFFYLIKKSGIFIKRLLIGRGSL